MRGAPEIMREATISRFGIPPALLGLARSLREALVEGSQREFRSPLQSLEAPPAKGFLREIAKIPPERNARRPRSRALWNFEIRQVFLMRSPLRAVRRSEGRLRRARLAGESGEVLSGANPQDVKPTAANLKRLQRDRGAWDIKALTFLDL